ncbi:Seven transmembrane MLO family protein [Euphorbia peplus]|nr:Seven transmembrane MLO family protein [Euphorbia peplus]
MGGAEAPGARELDQTPTWAVSAICAAIVLISIILEKALHHVGEWFHSRNKKALFEALEKVKTELMVLGFISLLLTFSQSYIARICIKERYANTMLPCPKRGDPHDAHVLSGGPTPPSRHGEVPASDHDDADESHEPPPAEHETSDESHGGEPPPTSDEHHRKLLWYDRRFLGGGVEGGPIACKSGMVPMISVNGLHQLHIFIFFLAVFHVIYSAITMTLGRLKIRGWKYWEREGCNRMESFNDPNRFRLTHEISFVRGHATCWTKNPVLFYIACFCQQFFRSVGKTDYLTMRHGFISVHLAPGSKFDFQKYIKRSLEDDFKVVVGISPVLWASVVLFLLLNVHGWEVMFWVSVLPVAVVLAIGTKLQAIITEMALEIQERHAVVQGIPLVQVSDKYFWFEWPQLILYFIHFVLFQNAFELTYMLWIWYEFGLKSCFHENISIIYARVALGIGAQLLCSYITLPLYALVTQMGSTMKRSIFDQQTSKALKEWQKTAAKKKHDGKTESRTLGATGRSMESLPDVELVDQSNPHQRQSSNVMTDVDLNDDDDHKSNAPPHNLI